MSETKVDVQKITEEIKAEIAAKGIKNDIPSFNDVFFQGTTSSSAKIDFGALRREIDYLKRHEVHYYRELTSYHKSFASVVTFVKRVIRKLCKFLGEPIVDELNEYHKHIVKALEHTVKALEYSDTDSGTKSLYETQLLEEHKYRLLAEQYATAVYRTEKDIQTMQRQLQQLQEQYTQLKLQSERMELKADIAKLQAVKEKMN